LADATGVEVRHVSCADFSQYIVHRPAHIAAMRYCSVAYYCTIIALETYGGSEPGPDTQRDLRAERAAALDVPFPQTHQ